MTTLPTFTQAPITTAPAPNLGALRTAEEHACAGYLAARKAMITAAARAASLAQLARERPRADYRTAADRAAGDYTAAVHRTRLAYSRWQRAQLFSDAAWTDTAGRNPQVLATAVTGEVAA
jgi:hypothetical protein